MHHSATLFLPCRWQRRLHRLRHRRVQVPFPSSYSASIEFNSHTLKKTIPCRQTKYGATKNNTSETISRDTIAPKWYALNWDYQDTILKFRIVAEMADASSNAAAAAASPPSQPAGTVAVKPITASAASSASKKGGAAKAGAKKARAKPSHPPTSEMVNNAVKSLKERGGSSLQAIKKYIAASYKVDAEKLSPFIKKYLKAAVTSGTLVQTKGKGASGSFKLSSHTLKEKAAPAAAATKAKKTTGAKKGAKKAAKPAGKKAAGAAASASGATKRSAPKERSKSAPPAKKAKKPAAEKPKKKAAGKPAAKAAKSPSKAKKATKPRAPKPKKTPTKAKPAAKKPAAQKKK